MRKPHQINAALFVLVLSINAIAQDPCAQTCAQTEAKRAEAALQLAAERVRSESLLALRDKLQQDIDTLKADLAKQKNQTGDTEHQLSTEQNKSSALAKSLGAEQGKSSSLAELLDAAQQEIASLTRERDKARTWRTSFARVFGKKGKK
jgi:chromosome segregation ATPase